MKQVILGASAAGLHGAATLRSRDPSGEIWLVSPDTRLYSRCILHQYIGGERDPHGLEFMGDRFIEKNRIQWKSGVSAQGLDPRAKEVFLSDGTALSYDKLLIAVGSSTRFPAIKGLGEARSGVYGLRTFEDAEQIKNTAPQVQHIVVLGAGLVGIDAVTGLLPFKKSLTLVELQRHILPLQLDQRAAEPYQEAFASQGVRQLYQCKVEEVQHDAQGGVKGLLLSTGETLPCQMLICATSVSPNVQFLQGSGIALDQQGLAFNAQGQTNDPSVYGAGDVSGRSPIWSAAVKEGIIAATNMTGGALEMTDFFASKTAMYFLGIRTLSLGVHTAPDEGYTTEIAESPGTYKKVIHKGGKIYGALIQGDLSYSGILTQLIRAKIDISQVKKPLYALDYSDFFTMTDNLEFIYKT